MNDRGRGKSVTKVFFFVNRVFFFFYYESRTTVRRRANAWTQRSYYARAAGWFYWFETSNRSLHLYCLRSKAINTNTRLRAFDAHAQSCWRCIDFKTTFIYLFFFFSSIFSDTRESLRTVIHRKVWPIGPRGDGLSKILTQTSNFYDFLSATNDLEFLDKWVELTYKRNLNRFGRVLSDLRHFKTWFF